MKLIHSYRMRHYSTGEHIYMHWIYRELTCISLELLSTTRGVRICDYSKPDPDLLELKTIPWTNIKITSRQYHRKRWKILQKGKR